MFSLENPWGAFTNSPAGFFPYELILLVLLSLVAAKMLADIMFARTEEEEEKVAVADHAKEKYQQGEEPSVSSSRKDGRKLHATRSHVVHEELHQRVRSLETKCDDLEKKLNQEMSSAPQPWAAQPPPSFPAINAAGGGPAGYRESQFMPPQHDQFDNYYPPIDKQPPYGRDDTVTMQVPLRYADAIIGTSGAKMSYIRLASGATIAIQETRGKPDEMTIEINGSASQVQTAQQLIHNFMPDAPAGGGGYGGDYGSAPVYGGNNYGY